MFDKLKQKFHSGSAITASSPAAPVGSKPDKRSIYQNRSNFGVNFGSLFVQERFIYDKLFVDNTGVELDAVKALVKKKGIDEARKDFESHWLSYCSDSDWEWLSSKGVQSVRIPIGYWCINSKFNSNTSFEKVSGVYANAWEILKKNFIQKASNYGISILVDLHALPKGANCGDHSGEKFSNAGFWTDSKAQSLACDILKFMAGDLQQFENVAGLQIVNESTFDNNASGQKSYYTAAANAIRSVNKSIPIIISDGWWPDQWCKWINESSSKGDPGIVIDVHIYRCFSDDDKGKDADAIIKDLDGSVLTGLSASADFMIGEYSCVLDGQTWDKSHGDRSSKVHEYGNRQSQLFKERAKFGSYFWCYKFEHGDGGEWGFRPMVDQGCIPAREKTPQLPSEDDFNKIMNNNLDQHGNYWNQQNPNEKYEHWRYKEGFTTAWADCIEFAKFDNSRIGRVNAWKNSRKLEHIKARGDSSFVWEWEQGFQTALDQFH
ncbi:glycoside hydrolase family 5 protein [[Candida] arabinofermentans NRRL YB-2248]|uniref:Glycoside hydrolase family 5 protein n=1 Tax=[Candida] arabinofermentans NRRL YB-2248 TaxID=983967 RepID=A0A1E4SZD3_9ASCO|nr:glycoside hydrolase family 5 protein [[Candida] arabinofermentans NRRL YB-2248]